MELHSLITASRSFRSFDRSVRPSHELLLQLVDCARLSPSSINLQMLKYRLVEREEECAALFPLTRWAGRIKDQRIPPEGHEPTAYILICADNRVTPNAEKFQIDVGIVAQSMMLAAREAGFGGCMIGSFSKAETAALLSLPEGLQPQLFLALGKPDEEITLLDADAEADVGYFRKDGRHYVPKRRREDLIL